MALTIVALGLAWVAIVLLAFGLAAVRVQLEGLLHASEPRVGPQLGRPLSDAPSSLVGAVILVVQRGCIDCMQALSSAPADGVSGVVVVSSSPVDLDQPLPFDFVVDPPTERLLAVPAYPWVLVLDQERMIAASEPFRDWGRLSQLARMVVSEDAR